jgi:MATE family multidrug resistance protein
MASLVRSIRAEFAPMLRLAAPLALGELGWMTMGIVDTIMAGRLGAAALGAGSLGNMVVYPVAICATGLLLGMDTLVSQSHGARDHVDSRRTLVNGVWLGLALSPLVAAVLLGLIPVLRAAGTNPRVMTLVGPFLEALLWGMPSLMLYAAFRRYLQAVDFVKPVMFALVSANLVNLAGNWALMFGHWGAPALGLQGSGLATSIARTYMAGFLLGAIVRHERRNGNLLFHISWRPAMARVRHLVTLGLPAAGQILFEGAVFAIVTALAARLDEASLAAHSVAVQVIATTFMVPLGISSAAAVRVGHAVGRKDPEGARTAGWTALLFSAIFMAAAGVALWTAPVWITRIYIRDSAVVAICVTLLRMAALLELFDGFQVVATGALRGLGDTRSPMLVHLAGYWIIGLPVTYVLCFSLGWGVSGIWVGLTAAIILIGASLVLVWAWRARQAGKLG